MKLLRHIGDKVSVARTLGNLGERLMRQGDLSGAKARFLEQLALGEARTPPSQLELHIPDDKQRGYALHGLGAALLAEGDLTGARATLEEAVVLSLRTNEPGWRLRAALRLLLSYLKWATCGSRCADI